MKNKCKSCKHREVYIQFPYDFCKVSCTKIVPLRNACSQFESLENKLDSKKIASAECENMFYNTIEANTSYRDGVMEIEIDVSNGTNVNTIYLSKKNAEKLAKEILKTIKLGDE